LARSWIAESPRWQREARSYRLGDAFRYFVRPPIRRTLSVAQGSYFLYQMTDQGLGMFLPLILGALWGTSVATAAWSSVVVKAVTIPAALCTVALIDRWGRKPLQVLGFAGRAIALGVVGGINLVDPRAPLVLSVGGMVAAYFFGPAGPDKTTVITPAEQFATPWRGTGEGLAEVAGRLGGVVGIAGFGLASAWWGAGAGLIFFGGVSALGALVSMMLDETRPLPHPTPAPLS
jgi:hypothetical protein